MSSLSKSERETIILWNQTDEPVSIQTYDAGLKRRLRDYGKKHPELCRFERSDSFGGEFYLLEKSRLSVRLLPPFSEERRKQASEQAKRNGFNSSGE